MKKIGPFWIRANLLNSSIFTLNLKSVEVLRYFSNSPEKLKTYLLLSKSNNRTCTNFQFWRYFLLCTGILFHLVSLLMFDLFSHLYNKKSYKMNGICYKSNQKDYQNVYFLELADDKK